MVFGEFGVPDPVTREGGHIASLWDGFFLAACAVGAFMLALILYTVVRYRGRGSDRIPQQGSANVLAEVIYTGTPIAIVVVLFVVSTGVERRVTRVAAKPAETVRVTALQWGWEFHYPAEGVTITGSGNERPPDLVLPLRVPILWPLVGADPLPRPVPYGARILAVLAAVPFDAFLGLALLSTRAPLAPPVYPSLPDQHAAGGLLWASGELMTLVAAALVLRAWMDDDERQAARIDQRHDLPA